MILITSNYKPTWVIDKKSKILFSNEWCKSYKDEKTLSNINHITFPYHWQDRNKLFEELYELDNIYEKYLNKLTIELNKLHNVNHSEKYWRIIIGPWLNDFIVLSYDYFKTIRNIDESKLVSNTYLIKSKWEDQVCQDVTSFQASYSTAWYNHFLFGEIIKLSSKINYEYLEYKHPKISNISSTTADKNLKEKLKRLVKYTSSLLYASVIIPRKFKKIVFVASYFSRKHLAEIQSNLGQLKFNLLFDPKPPIKKVNKELRSKIYFEDSGSDFLNTLNQLIPRQIPVAYIENYSSYRKISNLFFPKSPDVIFTSNSYYFNEAFKFWSAKNIEGKTKLLISQHGISGVSLRDPTEYHQLNISHQFYTWGWNDGTTKTKKMPSNKLSYTKDIMSYNPSGDVLCVVMSDIINYLNKQVPFPIERGYKDYIDELIKINQCVNQEIASNFRYRLYHTNFNRETLDVKYKFISSGLLHKVENNNLNFYESVKRSRLVIISYLPGTTSLEVLSANIPSLHFCPKNSGELNKISRKYYEKLKKAGVFYDDINSLSKKINEIYHCVDQWWYSKNVQDAISTFCDNYAYTCDDPIPDWVDELNSQIQSKKK